jgi:hypothetical protein
LLAEARDLASGDRRPSPVAVPGSADRQHLRCFLALRSPAIEHAEAARRIASSLPPGALLDRSRVDAAIARRLLERGAATEAVAAVIAAGPKAAAMPDAEAAGYVVRTMQAAGRFLGRAGGDPAQAVPADHGGAGAPGKGSGLLDAGILARRPAADAINPKHIEQSEGVSDMVDRVTERQRALRRASSPSWRCRSPTHLAHATIDPPPLKWSVPRYGFCNGPPVVNSFER